MSLAHVVTPTQDNTSGNIHITYFKYFGRLLAQVTQEHEVTQYLHIYGTAEWERRDSVHNGAMPYVLIYDVPTVLRNSLAALLGSQVAVHTSDNTSTATNSF